MDFNLLMELRQHLTIKHHVPGRIRIKFGLKLLADPRVQALKTEMVNKKPPSCIKETKLNLFTRSLVIEYDPDIVDSEKLHEALTTKDETRFQELAVELETAMDV